MSLILEVSRKQHLLVSLYAPGATVQSYETLVLDFATITQTSSRIISLVQQSVLKQTTLLSDLQELKKNGQILYDYLIPSPVKQQLSTVMSIDLTLLIEEEFIFIPWELLFDGQEFFCLRFNIGRRVRTYHAVKNVSQRSLRRPLMMQIIADPQGNLAQARKEAAIIRESLLTSQDICVTTKSKNVYKHFLQKNMRGYDLLHYAGHAKFDNQNPQASGWQLHDGILTCQDFVKLGESGPLPQLIFINACQSISAILPEEDKGYEQGLSGLAQAFLISGGRFVIGTVAKVADGSSAEIATVFYQYLVHKSSVGGALRKAREDFIQKLGVHDLTWAAYVFYGDPSGNIFEDPQDWGGVKKDSLIKLFHKQMRRKLWAVVIILVVAGGLGVFVPDFLSGKHRKIAWQLFLNGKYQQAILYYKRAMDFVPSDERSILGLYHAYIQLGRHKDAVFVLEDFIVKYPKSSSNRQMMILNFALGQGYYLLADYASAYTIFSRMGEENLSFQEKLRMYELLANSAALAGKIEIADQWYEKSIQLAGEHNKSIKRLHLLLAQADNICLTRDLASNAGISLSKAKEIYKTVLLESYKFNNKELLARANTGLGLIFQFQKDWGQSDIYFKSALNSWEEMVRDSSDVRQMLWLARTHLELASLNIDPQLDFNAALKNLEQADHWIRIVIPLFRKSADSVVDEKSDDHLTFDFLKLILRRFEILLRHLAQKGYQNSEFYKNASQIYDQLNDPSFSGL